MIFKITVFVSAVILDPMLYSTISEWKLESKFILFSAFLNFETNLFMNGFTLINFLKNDTHFL